MLHRASLIQLFGNPGVLISGEQEEGRSAVTQPRASSALRQPALAGASLVSCVLLRPALPLLWKHCPQQPWQSGSGVLGSVGQRPENTGESALLRDLSPPAASGGMLRQSGYGNLTRMCQSTGGDTGEKKMPGTYRLVLELDVFLCL